MTTPARHRRAIDIVRATRPDRSSGTPRWPARAACGRAHEAGDAHDLARATAIDSATPARIACSVPPTPIRPVRAPGGHATTIARAQSRVRPRAHQSGHSHDLAHRHGQRDGRPAPHRDLDELQRRRPRRVDLVLEALQAGHPAADHQRCQPRQVQSARRQRGDDVAVAQDGHVVGDGEHLLEEVADVDDATPRSRSRRMASKSRSRSAGESRAVGSSMTRMRASRESALTISVSCWSATPSGSHRAVHGQLDALRAGLRRGALPQRGPVDEAACASFGLTAEGDVLRHGELRDEREVLVDDGHAGVAAPRGATPGPTSTSSMRTLPV